MRRIGFWFSLVFPALAVIWGAWWGHFPLGIAGEWEWERVEPTEALALALIPPAVAAALFVGLVWLGARRIGRCGAAERVAWMCGLCLAGFTWLWVVQESAPQGYQLSKSAWVLYFRGSSGYYSEARETAGDLPEYLAGFEAELSKGDYLHIGTHPPGLVVIFRGLLSVCESYPQFTGAVIATEPESVAKAFAALQQSALHRQNALPRPDRAALWLASLLLQGGVALTVVPLYGLLRTGSSRRASWLAAAFWPTVPALAVFLPKSDCLYPLLALAFLWLWSSGLARRSILLCTLAGLTLWLGMLLSLAFVPIALIGLLATFGSLASRRDDAAMKSEGREGMRGDGRCFSLKNLRSGLGWNRSGIAWGLAGFAVPTLAAWYFLKLNLPAVWRLNFNNHARFYEHFSRSYGKWLLVSPLEFVVAAGVPVALLAAWSMLREWRRSEACRDAAPGLAALHGASRSLGLVGRLAPCFCGLPVHVWAWLTVFGLLWLSGKNMGEAARLWIFLMPFLVWTAGPLFDSAPGPSGGNPAPANRSGSAADFLAGSGWAAALAIQLVTTTAIVTRVAGFHYP